MLTLAVDRVGWLVGDASAVLAASAWPGSSAVVAARFATAFAIAQSMHYVVWIGFFPRYAPEATAAFERAFPALRRPWFAVGVTVLAVAMTALFLTSWADGRTVYGLVTAYHVYLEFPLLVFLAFGGAVVARPRATVGAT
ncbi:MAG: hypothetical protein R2731_02515 [Nocardioides sp.]